MKLANILSKVFALVAAGLILAVAVGYNRYCDTPLMILTSMEQPEKQTEILMEAICKGDYAAAENVLYGHPKLEWNPEQASELGTVIWDAFDNSISYEFSGGCYASSSGIFRDVTVTKLDIPALIPKIQECFQQLLAQRSTEYQKLSDVLDENGNYHESFVMGVLMEASEQVLQENNSVSRWNLTLKLIRQDGQWQIVPSQQLISIISGAWA